jgi:hypothetical protein
MDNISEDEKKVKEMIDQETYFYAKKGETILESLKGLPLGKIQVLFEFLLHYINTQIKEKEQLREKEKSNEN